MLAVEALQPAEHLARDGDRAVAVVGLVQRRPEHRHDPVAEIRHERAAAVHDRVAHLAQVVVEDADDAVRRRVLAVRGEPAQVAEEHRALAPHAAQPQLVVGAIDHLVDDALRHEAREEVAHPPALDRLVHHEHRQHRRGAHRQRAERSDHRHDPARAERCIRGRREQHAGGDREQEAAQLPQPQAGQHRDRAQAERQQPADPARRVLEREPAQDRRDRLGLDLGPAHQLRRRRSRSPRRPAATAPPPPRPRSCRGTPRPAPCRARRARTSTA